MIVSVYDYRAKMFHYYEVLGEYDRSTRYRALTQKPQGSRELGGIGYAPEALGFVLPANARQVGSGREARGVIATDPRGLSQVPVAMSPYLNGVDGLGTTDSALGATDAAAVVDVKASPTPFVQVVGAACVASVVGVLVQRALRSKRR